MSTADQMHRVSSFDLWKLTKKVAFFLLVVFIVVVMVTTAGLSASTMEAKEPLGARMPPVSAGAARAVE